MSVWEKSVTDRDFRLPEYKDARPEDYEFNQEGKPVRKDRFVVGFGRVASVFGLGGRVGYEIDDVVERVRKAVGAESGAGPWIEFGAGEHVVYDLDPGDTADVRLSDGSVLRGAEYSAGSPDGVMRWRARPMYDDVVAYRRTRTA